jgi:Fic family protein
MVTIKKREISGKTYYYLGHTYREGGKIKYREIYLGPDLPKNIEKIKKEFMLEIYNDRWFVQFEQIKKEYQRQLNKMPLEVRRKNLEAFVIRFTYDTNRIEGSKLSFKDTAALLEMGISPKNRPIRDVKEAEAHRLVFYEMLDDTKELSLGVILRWHKDMFSETKKGMAGKLRDYQVYISGSNFVPPPPEAIESYIVEFFRWYSAEKTRINPVQLAALAHLKFETIHPFGDGNGRIGRLVMNFILNKNGYPLLDIRYTDRRSYYNALERSNTKNDEKIFIQWLFKRYINESGIYLKKLKS